MIEAAFSFIYSASHVQRMAKVGREHNSPLKGDSRPPFPLPSPPLKQKLPPIKSKEFECVRCTALRGGYMDLDRLKTTSQQSGRLRDTSSDSYSGIHSEWQSSWRAYFDIVADVNPAMVDELQEHEENMEKLFTLLRTEAHQHIVRLDKAIRMERADKSTKDSVENDGPARCNCLKFYQDPHSLAREASRIVALHRDPFYLAGITILFTLLGCGVFVGIFACFVLTC